MKKIGLLFGRENTFPWAVIERINSKEVKGITAEPVVLDKCEQNGPSQYAVVLGPDQSRCAVLSGLAEERGPQRNCGLQ